MKYGCELCDYKGGRMEIFGPIADPGSQYPDWEPCECIESLAREGKK